MIDFPNNQKIIIGRSLDPLQCPVCLDLLRGLPDWKEVVGPYPVVSPGTREASFVHAISSAGVAHAVTRSCSSGELENCGCDRSLRGMSPEGFQVSVRSNGGIE